MTEQELKRLSRKELLELLILQMEENESLCRQLEEARQEVADRRILLDRAGSIAEAALAIQHIFEAADMAAALYLENVRYLAQRASPEQGQTGEQKDEGEGSSS